MFLALLALATLCLAGWSGECPYPCPSPRELRGESTMASPLLTPSTGSPYWQSNHLSVGSVHLPPLLSLWRERRGEGRRGRALGMSRGELGSFFLQMQSPEMMSLAKVQV